MTDSGVRHLEDEAWRMLLSDRPRHERHLPGLHPGGFDADYIELSEEDASEFVEALRDMADSYEENIGIYEEIGVDDGRSLDAKTTEVGMSQTDPDTPLLRHLKGLHDQSSHAGLGAKAKKAAKAAVDADGDGGSPKHPRAPRKRVAPVARKPKAPMGGSSNDDAISDDPSVKHAQAILDTEYNLWSAQYGDDPDRWPDDASAEYYKLKDDVAKARKKAAAGRSRTLGLCTRAFDFELDGPGDGRTLEGYAAVFNSPARIRDLQGDFDEVILPGAFTRSLQRRMPVLQWDHGKDPSVGTAPIGDIEELREDDHGLYVRARLYDSPSTERVRLAIKGKSVRGMSFRFGVPGGGDKWSPRSGDVDLREIREADTYELGPVVFPAYDTTSVSVRSILSGLDAAEMRELVHELAQYLRGAVDLTDFTGRPSTRGAGGGDIDLQPSSGGRSLSPENLRLEAEAFRALGVL